MSMELRFVSLVGCAMKFREAEQIPVPVKKSGNYYLVRVLDTCAPLRNTYPSGYGNLGTLPVVEVVFTLTSLTSARSSTLLLLA